MNHLTRWRRGLHKALRRKKNISSNAAAEGLCCHPDVHETFEVHNGVTSTKRDVFEGSLAGWKLTFGCHSSLRHDGLLCMAIVIIFVEERGVFVLTFQEEERKKGVC